MKYIFASKPIDEEAIREKVLPFCKMENFSFEIMQQIHSEFGVDYSSLYVRESLTQSSTHKEFLNALENSPRINNPSFEIIIIPSLFYLQHSEIGGDGNLFKLIAKRLGVSYQTAPINPLGSISRNAELLISFFEKLDWSKPKWLVALSKGGADLKLALMKLSPEYRRSIRGIFNISSAHGGSKLCGNRKGARLNYFFMKSWLTLRGADKKLLKEMEHEHEFSRREYPQLENAHIINIFGLPSLSYLRKPVIQSYLELSQYGPNDGYILTSDLFMPKEKNIVLWGADHYVRVPELNIRIEQSIRWVNQQELRNE